MSSLPNGLTFQVQIQPPSNSNISSVKKQMQQTLGQTQINLQLKNAVSSNKQLQAVTKSTKEATKATRTFGDAVGLAGRNFVAYTSAVAIIGRLSIALSRATRDAIKFEREFVKLAQVYNTNAINLRGLRDELSTISKQFGISANVIAKTSVVLAQSGLTAKETAKAIKVLSKTTLASTFQNIGLTAEGAVAIMAQFGEGVGALESQLSQINSVAKRFAVESSDIIEAVRRGGGAFKAAGGNLTEFISLFTAVRSTTRESAETISTGFRTIFARLQRPKVIDYFKELNIELQDSSGNFVGAFEAVKRLSQGLDKAGIKAGQIKFAEVVEQLGGIRQVSRVIPLLNQFTKAEKAKQDALSGGLSLDADVAKAQATVAQSIERTRQNFAALIREISQTQSFKTLIDFGLKLANAFLEIARTLKPLIPLIATLGTFRLGSVFGDALKTGFSKNSIGSKRPFANGGPVLGFNRGGSVPGSGNGDTVPAMLEPGEFVIKKSAVQAFGEGGLADINKYAGGGPIKASKLSKNGLKTIANHYDTGPEVDDNPHIRINTKYDADDPSKGNLYSRFRKLAYVKFSKAIKDSDRVKGGGQLFLQKLNKLKYLGEDLNEYKDTSTKSSIFGIGSNYTTFKKLFKSNSPEQGQYLNKTSGALAEIFVNKKKLNSATKLATKYGADFEHTDAKNRFSEVKTLREARNDVDGTTKLSAKAALAHGFRQTEAGKSFKGNKDKNEKPILDEPKITLDYYNFYKKFAKGGSVGTDTVPSLLTPGEFVINKKSAQAFGYGGLAKINKFAKGGPVGVQKFASGGEVSGGSAFGFITEAAAQFGLLFFAISQISAPLKKFQEGLTKGEGTIKKEIAARKQEVEAVSAVSEILEKKLDKIFLDKLDKEKEVSKASDRLDADRVATQDIRSSKDVATRADEADVPQVGQFTKEMDDNRKRLSESYRQLEGANGPVLSNVKELGDAIFARTGSMPAVLAAEEAYLRTVEATDNTLQTNQGVVDNLNSEMVSLTSTQRGVEQQFSKLHQSIPSKAFSSVKKSLISFESGLGKALSRVRNIAITPVGSLAQSARGGIASGARRAVQFGGAATRVAGKKIKAGVQKAGQAIDDNPLAVVAGVAASLRAVLGGVASTFQKISEQAIASGDAEEAATNAKLAAEAKAINNFTTASIGAGATIGSAFGPIGTIIGSLVGAVVGVLSKFKLFQDGIDGAITVLNYLPGVDIQTFAGSIEKAGKDAEKLANRNKLEKEIEAIGTKFRNLGRSIDPKTNLAGFAQAADRLAKVTNEQALAIKQAPVLAEDGSIDTDEQARRLAENSKAAASAFSAAANAANVQGKSLINLAQDSPELAKAFINSLPPEEAQAIWKQMVQTNQAAIAAIAAENAARLRGINIFLAQLNIQDRINASLQAMDQQLQAQTERLSRFDFALTGNIQSPDIGADLTDFSQAGTADFQLALAEVSRLGPDFRRQAQEVSGGLNQLQGFARNLADPTQVRNAATNLANNLAGILPQTQVDEIRARVDDFAQLAPAEQTADRAAALEKALIADFITPLAKNLEDGRDKINQRVKNFAAILDKQNELEKQSIANKVSIVESEQAVIQKISSLLDNDLSAAQLSAQKTSKARTALTGSPAAGALTGNSAADVSTLGRILSQNNASQKNIAGNISSGTLSQNQLVAANAALKGLQLEANKLETAMEILGNTTDENAAIEKELNKSREQRAAKREVATNLAFGTQESRGKFFDTLGAARSVGQAGSAEVIPESKRGDVLSLFKQFSSSRVFGGRTGKEAEKAATSSYLSSIGVPLADIANVMDDFILGELDMITLIRENYKVDIDRNKILAQIRDNNAQGLASGGTVYASGGSLVNFQPKGTDTVPAMLTPGEFVMKKSSVDKYGSGMMESINSQNFAQGGGVDFKPNRPYQRFGKDKIFKPDQILSLLNDQLSIPKIAGRSKITSSDTRYTANPNDQRFVGETGGINNYADLFFKPILQGGVGKDKSLYLSTVKEIFNGGFAEQYGKVIQGWFGVGDQTLPSVFDGVAIQGNKTFAIEGSGGPPQNPIPLLQATQSLVAKALSGVGITSVINRLSKGRLLQDLQALPLTDISDNIRVFGFGAEDNFQLNQQGVIRRNSGAGRFGAVTNALKDDPVNGFNTGGPVGGIPGIDANPAMLTRGEYVINKKSAELIGTKDLNRLNSVKRYNKGGKVGYYADGGSVSSFGNSSESYQMFSNSVDKLIGGNGFAMFKESVDKFNAIPKELTLTLAPTQVTVTFNGAEILSRITPMIQDQILTTVSSEINTLKEDLKSGNI